METHVPVLFLDLNGKFQFGIHDIELWIFMIQFSTASKNSFQLHLGPEVTFGKYIIGLLNVLRTIQSWAIKFL